MSTVAAGSFAEFRTGWKVVLGGLAGMICGAPTLAYYSIGLFAPYLSKEFGWSYSFVLSGLMVLTASFLPLGPAVGHLVDRLGARRVGATALVLFGVSYASLGLSTGSQVQYVASWLAIAIFGVGATAITFTRAVNGLFQRRRGLALGITLAGSGIYIIILKLGGQHLIDAVGWRLAFATIGMLPVTAAPVVLWGLPKAGGVRPVPSSAAGTRPQSARTGLTFGEAVRGWRFWAMAISFLPTAFAGAAPMPNMENILRSTHVAGASIPVITSLIGFSMIFGRVAGGYAIDRIWAPLVAFIVVLGGASACIILSQDTVHVWQAVLSVVLLGLTAGIELDLMAYMVVRYMGLRSYGTIYGVLYALFFIAAGFGPSFMARTFDQTGSYAPILFWSGIGMLITGGAVLTMGRYARYEEAH